MAAELGLLSLTQLQKLAQFQPPQPKPPTSSAAATTSSWMWNPKQVGQDEDDSWEVRAFEQDTGNINGTTWPPRSYTCTFCRREFRSAQALGGHMNVHRRDRARLHQVQPCMMPNSAAASPTTLIIPSQEFVANGGLCLVYSLANNPSATILNPTPMNSCMDSPSTLLSVSNFPTNNSISPCGAPTLTNYPPTPHSLNSSICQSSNNTALSASNSNENISTPENTDQNKKDSAPEELDLELRLGPR